MQTRRSVSYRVYLASEFGFLFAKTYEETGSLIISGIEHALYGSFIFTIGLGKYFYYGAFV